MFLKCTGVFVVTLYVFVEMQIKVKYYVIESDEIVWFYTYYYLHLCIILL